MARSVGVSVIPSVTISEAALAKLNADPKLRAWKREPRRDRVPMLHYYLRLYSTAHDGTVIEHGDGFHLTFVDPDEERPPHVAGYERVPLGDGHDVVVEIQTSHAACFTIGLARRGYTYEPRR